MEKEANWKEPVHPSVTIATPLPRSKTFLENATRALTRTSMRLNEICGLSSLSGYNIDPVGGAVTTDKELSAKSVCNVYIELSALYTWAVKLEFVSNN
jgi:hypothetical protein